MSLYTTPLLVEKGLYLYMMHLISEQCIFGPIPANLYHSRKGKRHKAHLRDRPNQQ